MFVEDQERQSADYSLFWKSLNEGRFHCREFKRIRKDGQAIWIQAMYFPVTDAEGTPTKVVKFASDITKEVKLRERSRSAGSAVSESIEQMSSTISEISQVVGRTVDLTNITEQEVGSTNAFVNELSTSSRTIETVVGVIRGLAEQTNLLALNATIESARAGESGKGFAVVANEVKELAKETASATENIVASVTDIQRLVSECLESATRVTTSIGSVTESMTTIAAAVEEQAATMGGLNETAAELRN
jgi:methyl-accepting chemotaxis protein